MAKGLGSLVRVSEWNVDECRRALGVHLRDLNELEISRSKLEQELKNEQVVAADHPDEAGLLYGLYAVEIIDRREIIDQAIRRKEKEIIHARDELNKGYRELKKYELIRDNRVARERDKERMQEQNELDDVGVEMFRRGS